jgi:hypothetical protein
MKSTDEQRGESMPSERDFKVSEEGNALIREAAKLMGQKGGPAAARVRFSKMTAEQRSEHGRRLAAARWNKRTPDRKEQSSEAGEP